MKIAKVITTSFVPRVVREDTGLAGSPMGYFSHSQNFQTEESVIDLINWVIDSESMCNPGYPVDLIIVNNDSGWGKGVNFLKKIDLPCFHFTTEIMVRLVINQITHMKY